MVYDLNCLTIYLQLADLTFHDFLERGFHFGAGCCVMPTKKPVWLRHADLT